MWLRMTGLTEEDHPNLADFKFVHMGEPLTSFERVRDGDTVYIKDLSYLQMKKESQK